MKRILLYLFFTIGISYNLYGQTYPIAIENNPSPQTNLRVRSSYNTTSNILDGIPPSNELVALTYFNGWVMVDMPSPDQNSETIGYVFVGCQHGLFNYKTGYVYIQNAGISGAPIMANPGSQDTVTMGSVNSRTLTGYAEGWDGQYFACTGQQQTINGITWYQIFLTSDCNYPTGWVSNQFAAYTPPSISGTITSSNSTQNVPASATSCSFNISSNTTYCESVQSSTLQNLIVTPSMNNALDPTSGIGNGPISCTFNANTSNTPQSATIVLSEDVGTGASLTLTINQAAATPTCTYNVSSTTGTSFPSSGGSGSINITTGSSCNWSVSNIPNWITVSSNSGTGSGTITYTVSSNNSTNPLSGNITIEGQSVPISEAANTSSNNNCSYSATPVGNTNFPGSGGTGTINVTAGSTCPPWNASTTDLWITVNSSSITGSGTVTYSVAQNTTSNPLSGNITIAGQSIPITEAGSGTQTGTAPVAAFALSSSTIAQGGSVTTTDNSTGSPTTYLWWTSAPSGGAVFSPGSGTSSDQAPSITFNAAGTFTVYLMVTNASGSNETYQTITVTATPGCSYSLTPTLNTSVPATGGTYSIAVNNTGGNNCNWTATTQNLWININSGSPGTGNGTVSYSISANPGNSSRQGTISIGGQNFEITQAGVPAQATISIDESATTIPPWQREGEGFSGQITVDLSQAGPNATWHIEADGFDQNGNYLGDTLIGEGTSGNTIQFNFSDIKKFGLVGYHINWNAVLETNNAHQTDPVQTNIIDAEWVTKNIVYYNDGTHSLNIPIKYIPGCTEATISFSRVPHYSTYTDDIESTNPSGQFSESFEPNSSSNDYFTINNGNSNLGTIAPGIFNFTIAYYNFSGVQLQSPENEEFDLTKIGNVNTILGSTNVDKNKVVILIAGINDNIEAAIDALANIPPGPVTDNSEWSIANALTFGDLAPGNTNYNTWYIGTINVNRIQRNAYDIGISIDSIINILSKPPFNLQNPDINLIVHSKGGAETDVMLDGKGAPLGSDLGFGFYSPDFYNPSNLFHYLHSINFLGAIHAGGAEESTGPISESIAALCIKYPFIGGTIKSILPDIYEDIYCPGFYDMFPGSDVMRYLNQPDGINIPTNSSIRIGNITGYGDPYGDLALPQGFLTLIKENVFNNYFRSPQGRPGDGVVAMASSGAIDSNLNNNKYLYQYYVKEDIQDNILKIKILHTWLNRLHTLEDPENTCGVEYPINDNLNSYLTPSLVAPMDFTSDGSTPSSCTCFFPPTHGTIDLLDRIVNIINDNNILPSCTAPTLESLSSQTINSILSNAQISIYYAGHSFVPVAKTDENGMSTIYFYNTIPVGDSILITSPGIDDLKLTIDSNMAKTGSFKVAMFRKTDSKALSEPILSLVNQEPITSKNTVIMNVTARNATQYQINSSFNQDSTFVPLSLNNNQFTAQLDTGINFITVRFIGKQDTVSLTKMVSYLPDSLMNAWTNNLNINTPQNLIGAKVFVNNQFYQNITSANTDLKILAGYSEVKFSRFGYRDTVLNIRSDSSIQLSMLPYSYSSLTDSSNINFGDGLNPQYWKNITVMEVDTPQTGMISLKQYDDSFANMGLQPETRDFVFHNLTNNSLKLKAAMALDQANAPDSSDVYLLSIQNGVYTKYLANFPNLTEYDPEVQKVEFDSMDLTPSSSEQLALMKKLPPIMQSPALKYASGKIQKIPLALFAQNPDSIPHDLQITATITGVPFGVEAYLDSNYLYVNSPIGDSGDITLHVTATHDFISMSKDYDIKLTAPPLTKNNMILYPNSVNEDLNIVLEVADKYLLTSLTIYNVSGQVVKVVDNDHPVYKGYHTFDVQLGYLPAGIYFVEWRGVMTKKFIKYSISE